MTEAQLQALFGDLTVVQAVLKIVAIVALLALLMKIWPILTKFVVTLNALTGLPEKLEQIDELTGKVNTIQAQVKEIHHETHFNSGTSIKDATKRIEAKVDELHVALAQRDDSLEERIDALEDTFTPKDPN